jgi:hypothetical protein
MTSSKSLSKLVQDRTPPIERPVLFTDVADRAGWLYLSAPQND